MLPMSSHGCYLSLRSIHTSKEKKPKESTPRSRRHLPALLAKGGLVRASLRAFLEHQELFPPSAAMLGGGDGDWKTHLLKTARQYQ